ncbi:MAG: hypothetical protein AAF944_06225 [Bacteroidota bacterium]
MSESDGRGGPAEAGISRYKKVNPFLSGDSFARSHSLGMTVKLLRHFPG